MWNDVRISLGRVFATTSLMSAVHPDPAVMEEAERLEIEARAFSTDLYLDAGIYDLLVSLEDVPLDEGAAPLPRRRAAARSGARASTATRRPASGCGP